MCNRNLQLSTHVDGMKSVECAARPLLWSTILEYLTQNRLPVALLVLHGVLQHRLISHQKSQVSKDDAWLVARADVDPALEVRNLHESSEHVFQDHNQASKILAKI